MMRNRAIATGLAIGMGIAANVAPASANSGGVGPEGAGSGGVGASSTSGMGGIKAERSNLAAKIRFLKEYERNGKGFNFLGMDPNACDPDATNRSSLEVKGDDGTESVDSLVILKQDGSGIAYYVGRLSRTALVLIPAEQAQVVEYPGQGDNTPIPVENPEDCMAPHTFHATLNHSGGVPSFRAEDGKSFGVVVQASQSQ